MSENAKTKITATALRAYIMIAVLGLIWLYFHWATDYVFMTPRNLSNLMTQMSVTGIIAIGMLMVIVSGNIDLSVGSVLGFAGGIAAYGMTVLEFGLPAAIIAAVFVGMVIGIFHGTLTAYLNIPAFIVTLGGLLAWRGAVKWLLGGNTIPISDETFKGIGNANLPVIFGWGLAVVATAFVLFMAYRKARSVKDYGLGEANYASELLKAIIPIGGIVAFIGVMNAYQGVPVPVLILVAVALIGGFLTNSTVFGRYLYAIGGNADAARLSGINNKRNILKVYALLGALTGVAVADLHGPCGQRRAGCRCPQRTRCHRRLRDRRSISHGWTRHGVRRLSRCAHHGQPRQRDVSAQRSRLYAGHH